MLYAKTKQRKLIININEHKKISAYLISEKRRKISTYDKQSGVETVAKLFTLF